MFETLVRFISGVVSLVGGLVTMPLLFVVSGMIKTNISSASPPLLGTGLLVVLFLALLSLVVLFACGIHSMRSGPPRPTLWLSCIGAGMVSAVAGVGLKLLA